MVDPSFIYCHMSTQKIRFSLLEQVQTALGILDALLVLVGCEETRHPLLKELSNPQRFVQNCKHAVPSDIFKVLAISRNFKLFFINFNFGQPEHSASSVFLRPRLNSKYQSMIVDFTGAESP